MGNEVLAAPQGLGDGTGDCTGNKSETVQMSTVNVEVSDPLQATEHSPSQKQYSPYSSLSLGPNRS